MRRFIIIASLLFVPGALGVAQAQQPAADMQMAPAEKRAEPAAAPAEEKPPVGTEIPPGNLGKDGSMIDPGPPGPAVAPPTGTPTPVPNTAPPASKQPAKPNPNAAGGKVSEAEKDAFLKALAADEAWRDEVKDMIFDRIVLNPKSKKDFTLRERMADTLRPEIHKVDSNRMLRNKKHVVYAYAALWVLTALFVLFMFIKQRNLTAEIEQLRSELEEAVK